MYQENVKTLNELFDIINAEWYDNELPKVNVTLQKSKGGILGHATIGKVWVNEDGTKTFEVNINPLHTNREPEEVLRTLAHEAVHIYHIVNDIKDCSRGNTYHNKRFAQGCADHGLTAEKGSKGYHTHCEQSEEWYEFANRVMEGLTFAYRTDASVYDKGITKGITKGTDGGIEEKKKTGSRKYVCPTCGVSVRATKEVNVRCADCDELMEQE